MGGGGGGGWLKAVKVSVMMSQQGQANIFYERIKKKMYFAKKNSIALPTL